MTTQTIGSIVYELVQHGLVVSENDDHSLLIVCPESAGGVNFPGHDDAIMHGLGDVTVMAKAPRATITRRRRPVRWVVDISEVAALGRGPVYFNESFGDINDAADAVVNCYFGDHIDFGNESLKAWGLSDGGIDSTKGDRPE